MSMHLEGPGLTTTRYRKPKEKMTKARRAELESGWRERNVRLKEMGLPKETFEQYLDWVYGRGKKTKSNVREVAPTLPTNRKATEPSVSKIPSLRTFVTGPCATKPSPTYTGTKIIGIGTMHKSNMVPVFSDEEAKDISKMRRG